MEWLAWSCWFPDLKDLRILLWLGLLERQEKSHIHLPLHQWASGYFYLPWFSQFYLKEQKINYATRPLDLLAAKATLLSSRCNKATIIHCRFREQEKKRQWEINTPSGQQLGQRN